MGNDTPESKQTKDASLKDKVKTSDTKTSPQFRYFAPPNSTSIWDVAIIIFYHMLPFTPLPLIFNVLFLSWAYKQYGWWALAAIFTLCAILLALPPFYSRSFRRRLQFLYSSLARYVPKATFIAPTTPIPQQSYIFAFHPHGRMFYSNTMMIQLDNIWRYPFLPKGDLFAAAAAGFFSVPFLRNLLYMIGAMPASRANIVRRLRQGNHVAIVVGGVKEVCVGTEDNVDTLYLLKRKGFIKIAMEEKAGIIPIYCFNENKLFCHDPKWLLKFWENVNRHVNVGVPFMRGIFKLPVPFRRELFCVVGDPVFPREGESVDDFHSRYVEHLKALFYKYVEFSPSPAHKLVIT